MHGVQRLRRRPHIGGGGLRSGRGRHCFLRLLHLLPLLLLFQPRRLVGPADHLGGDGAGHRADVALQVAHAGLAGVALDDPPQRVVLERGLVGGQAVGLELPGDEVALGDVELVVLGVAGDLDDLHAVAQRAGHRVHAVGGGDEQHLAQVERHVEVVVGEGVVLGRVQHFQQGRGGVAAEIGAELVDLVEHHDRVARAGLATSAMTRPGMEPM